MSFTSTQTLKKTENKVKRSYIGGIKVGKMQWGQREVSETTGRESEGWRRTNTTDFVCGGHRES